MKKIILFFILFFFIGENYVQSQKLYIPRNIAISYNNSTRSMNGNPGKNYWQNEGKYDINITVTPETKIVSGTEKIVYINNSPDTLKMIAIRFVNHFHKPLAPRVGYASPDVLTSGLDIKSFSVNDEDYKINSKDWGTVAAVRLKKPLEPHTSIDPNIG